MRSLGFDSPFPNKMFWSRTAYYIIVISYFSFVYVYRIIRISYNYFIVYVLFINFKSYMYRILCIFTKKYN